jgi:hypothetical protein
MQEVENQAIENNEVVVEQPIVETESTEEVESTGVEDVVEDIEEDSTEEIAEDGDSEVDEDGEEKFPKKAERALERRNKKIKKFRTENAELREKLAAYESQPQPREQISNDATPEGLSVPQEEDFEDYADFLRAEGEYKVRKEMAIHEANAQEQKFVESQQQWVQQRAQEVDLRAAEAAKTIPELEGLYRENQDIIEGYSDATKLAFLEAEKPELAFYALAQEGKLEELDGMSPMGVARAIALAEIKGEKLAKVRPVSKAPAPIKPARGSSPKRVTLDDMSPTELLEYLKKQKRK